MCKGPAAGVSLENSQKSWSKADEEDKSTKGQKFNNGVDFIPSEIRSHCGGGDEKKSNKMDIFIKGVDNKKYSQGI